MRRGGGRAACVRAHATLNPDLSTCGCIYMDVFVSEPAQGLQPLVFAIGPLSAARSGLAAVVQQRQEQRRQKRGQKCGCGARARRGGGAHFDAGAAVSPAGPTLVKRLP